MKQRLNVLFWPAWYPRDSHPSDGIFVRRFAEAVNLYHNVAVICVYSEGKWREIKGVYKIETRRDEGITEIRVNCLHLGLPPFDFFLRLLGSFIAFIKLIKSGFKPDIIHLHVFSAPLTALLISKLYGIPLILTEHAAEFTWHKLSYLEVLRAKIVANNCRLILPVSPDLSEALRSYGIDKPLRVVPNVVDTTAFHPLPKKERESHRERKPTRFLSVGNLIPRKNFSCLIMAGGILAQKRSDWEIWIVGDGPLKDQLEKLAEKKGIEKQVKFLGYKKPVEVAEIMRQAHIFVFPTLNETFGCVVVEAMASGLPVIATDVPGVRWIVAPHTGLLVPPNNPSCLAEAMDYMLDNHHLYDPDSIASYARSTFNYHQIGKMLDDIYRMIKNAG